MKELSIATLTDSFTQRLCSIECDAPLERLAHILEKSNQVVKPDNCGVFILASRWCHEASYHNTFASDDAEMDALIYRLNVLVTRTQCKMVMTTLQALAHARQVIAAILNICISPAITADNTARYCIAPRRRQIYFRSRLG